MTQSSIGCEENSSDSDVVSQEGCSSSPMINDRQQDNQDSSNIPMSSSDDNIQCPMMPISRTNNENPHPSSSRSMVIDWTNHRGRTSSSRPSSNHHGNDNYQRSRILNLYANNNVNSNNNDNNNNSATSALSTSSSSNDFFFDASTFKQVKRLYCGMLMVAMAYSVTMIIIMAVLYKSLPDTSNSAVHWSAIGLDPHNISKRIQQVNRHRLNIVEDTLNDSEIVLNDDSQTRLQIPSAVNTLSLPTTASTFYQRFHHQHQLAHSTRTHIDQVIAINFLTFILYLLALYAAQREFYSLTLAFTSMLIVSMTISLAKIVTEGAHFPNNLMGVLLRMSIVFVSYIYSVQVRRKHMFIANANTFWLNNPMLSRASNSTVQLINEILVNQTSAGQSAGSDSSGLKAIDMIREYQDQPPDYEEALRCPVACVRPIPPMAPIVLPIPLQSLSSSSTTTNIPISISTNSLTSSSSGPPSFDQLLLSSTTTFLSSDKNNNNNNN